MHRRRPQLYPPGKSVNCGIPRDTYLGEPFSLHLPSLDGLLNIIRQKGHNCHLFKKDLSLAYHQLRIDPCDYHLLGRHCSSFRTSLLGYDVSEHHFCRHLYVQDSRLLLYKLHTDRLSELHSRCTSLLSATHISKHDLQSLLSVVFCHLLRTSCTRFYVITT